MSPWNSLSHPRTFTALLSRLQAITSSRKYPVPALVDDDRGQQRQFQVEIAVSTLGKGLPPRLDRGLDRRDLVLKDPVDAVVPVVDDVADERGPQDIRGVGDDLPLLLLDPANGPEVPVCPEQVRAEGEIFLVKRSPLRELRGFRVSRDIEVLVVDAEVLCDGVVGVVVLLDRVAVR